MFLIKQTITSFIWLYRVFSTMLKVQPLVTVTIIVMQTLSKVLHLIAFLLPIKVILLVGSDGIPKYFRFFIEKEDKVDWAIGLVLASIVFYFLTLIIDGLNNRLNMKGGKQISVYANELMIFANQEERAKNYYEKINDIFTLQFFILVSGIALAYLDIVLLLVYFLFVVAFLLINSLIISYRKSMLNEHFIPGNNLSIWIVDNKKNYVKVLSTVIFLSCFMVILAPYFFDSGKNLLLSLISLILIRQTVNSSQQLVNKIINANSNKEDINSLVFVDHVKKSKTNQKSLSFFEQFNEEARIKMVKEHLPEDLMSDTSKVFSFWSETSRSKVKVFDIVIVNDNHKSFYKHYVFTSAARHVYEKEGVLLKFMERETLKGAEVVARFQVDTHQCTIVDFRSGKSPTDEEWEKVRNKWEIYFTEIRPSPDLVRAFKKSEQFLHQRLKETLFLPVELAVESADDKEHLTQFIASLPNIRKRIRKLPLYIHNKILFAENICLGNESGDDITVLSWRNWTLAPIGAGLEINDDSEGLHDISDYVAMLSASRGDIRKKNIAKEDLMLSSYAWNLEIAISNQKYREALSLMKKINKLVE